MPGPTSPFDNPYQPTGLGNSASEQVVEVLVPADHGKRFVASLIDGIVQTILFGGPFFVALMVLPPNALESWLQQSGAEDGLVYGIAGLFAVGHTAYFSAFQSSSWHATPGKLAMGLVVTDRSGYGIGLGRAILRAIFKYVSSQLCALVALYILMNDDANGVWDALGGTRVVERNPPLL